MLCAGPRYRTNFVIVYGGVVRDLAINESYKKKVRNNGKLFWLSNNLYIASLDGISRTSESKLFVYVLGIAPKTMSYYPGG